MYKNSICWFFLALASIIALSEACAPCSSDYNPAPIVHVYKVNKSGEKGHKHNKSGHKGHKHNNSGHKGHKHNKSGKKNNHHGVPHVHPKPCYPAHKKY